MTGPVFPPLFTGQATVDDPMQVAVDMARQGCDAGTIVYNLSGRDLRAAIIFAPEVPLAQAMAMLPVCGIGFQNALGSVAPPEVAVHLKWDGTIMVNGAACGALTAQSATGVHNQLPNWLTVGLTVPLWPAHDPPGEAPDVTALYAEGCSDITTIDLIEGWARHTLVWINRWLDEGTRPIHAEFTGIWQKNEGELGLDPDLGLLSKYDDVMILTPLTKLLEPA
ncbi:biotin/lipoate--protein ligase family protein [Yoonia maritima]|uniref:biotin/lipoate--protein ligase family protein n=1 Tax=Yoonia maritima TaxID=1435347 RepID=UPI000D0F7317|nr:biotin/lipoate--protein ligase family protein [Yoonia maritima]